MSKKNFTLFLILLCSFISSAQYSEKKQQKLDSLTSVIQNSDHDTIVIRAYFKLSELLYKSNLDTSIFLCNKAKEIASKNLQQHSLSPNQKEKDLARSSFNQQEKKFYQQAIAEALNNNGYIYYLLGNTEKAAEHFLEAKTAFENLGSKLGIATSYNNLGKVYKRHGDINKALKYYHESLKILEEIGDKENIAKSLNNIGRIFKDQGQINEALEYNHRSLRLREETNDISGIATSLNNIGKIYQLQHDHDNSLEYFNKALKYAEKADDKVMIIGIHNNIGLTLNQLNKSQEALENYNLSLSLAKEIKHKKGISNALNNIALIYKQEKKYHQALEYYSEALAIEKKAKNIRNIITIEIHIAQLYVDLGAFNKAKTLLLKSLEKAQRLGHATLIRNAAYTLSLINGHLNNPKEELKFYKLYVQMRDSLQNIQIEKEALRQKMNYEFEKEQAVVKVEHQKQLDIVNEQTKRQRAYLVFTIAAIVLLIMLGIFIYRSERNKRKLIRSELTITRLKKEGLENTLSLKNKELTSLSLRIIQNNQFSAKLNELISDIAKSSDISKSIQNLKKQIRLNKTFEKDQLEFEKQFEGVHKHFIKNLKTRFPQLTTSEIRICTLIKMNMSTNNISSLLGISIDSLKTFRYRIHKKMNLEKGVKLSDFIIEFS